MIADRFVTCLCAALLSVTGFVGCGDVDPDALTIVTTWTAPDRAEFEKAIRTTLPEGTRLRWVVLAPGDDIRHVVRHRVRFDMILGGPASSYARLAEQGVFETDGGGAPSWKVISKKAPGLLHPRPEGYVSHRRGSVCDDPRRDPVSLAWLESALQIGTWPRAYGNLVNMAGAPAEFGRQPGSTRAGFERGENANALSALSRESAATLSPQTAFHGSPKSYYHEGVGVVAGARHALLARSSLDDLERRGHVEPPPRTGRPSETDSLTADLLGATLVDAHEELVAAHRALNAAGFPSRPSAWMKQPPPWPPASITKLLERESNAMPMLETLAGQIAPDPDVRAWLLQSWLAPPRPIDGALLDELTRAVDGRLAREPRFRAWLRAEWTAWARQRYRRVNRQVTDRKFAEASS